QVPLVNGIENARRLLRADVLAQFIEVLAEDRKQRYTQGSGGSVPVVAPEGEPCALPSPDSYEWFTKTGETRAPNWVNQVSLESMDKCLEYNPAANLALISPSRVVMVVASIDTLTPTDLALTAY